MSGAAPRADFEGCVARLMWAGHQLNALDEEFRIWMREHDPHSTTVEYYPEANVHLFRLSNQPPPLRFGVVAGNIVHQLRATLDNLVWQLVFLNGKTPRGGVGGNQFPIMSNLKEGQTFSDETGSKLRGVSPSHAAQIERLQPYMSPDWPTDISPPLNQHPLGRLASLSNADKHQVLKAVRVEESRPPLAVDFNSDTADPISVCGWAAPEDRHPGAIVGWVQATPDGFHPDMYMEYAGWGLLVFEDGLPIIGCLRAIAGIVHLIVTGFSIHRADDPGLPALSPQLVEQVAAQPH